MEKHVQLTEGQELRYTGKVFDGFEPENPKVVFLGYDSIGWEDVWVDYKGKNLMVRIQDVELA